MSEQAASPTDRIREAAGHMIEHHPKGHQRHMFWGSLAAWLLYAAQMMENQTPDYNYPAPSLPMVVAAYYLDSLLTDTEREPDRNAAVSRAGVVAGGEG